MEAGATPEKAPGASEPSVHPSDASCKIVSGGDIPNVESPRLVPEQGDQVDAPAAAAPPVTALVVAHPRSDSMAQAGTGEDKRPKRNWNLPKVSQIAATILIAAAVGALAGSVGTYVVSVATTIPAPDPALLIAETRTLKDTVAHLRADLAGVKAGSEVSTRAAAGQLARMAERLDRAERAEKQRVAMAPVVAPAATVPALQSPIAANTNVVANEATGSIPMPASRPSVRALDNDSSRLPIIQGWVLRSVYDGTAYIQTRYGPMEVEVGDGLPNGGRVEAIRRENGRWVVFTTRGLVVMR